MSILARPAAIIRSVFRARSFRRSILSPHEELTMGRPSKSMAEWIAAMGPLREHWREVNRQDKEERERIRAQIKASDKNRPKCRCAAYPWPHRPGGGLCRWPDPPVECWQRKHVVRPYRWRYTGLRRQIARANGLHPVKDRDQIFALVEKALHLAKELKRRCPRLKYRNMQITENGVSGSYQSAGPVM